MESLSPHVGYGGVYGRVTKIWWGRRQGQQFAISVEEGSTQSTYWVLWILMNGRWEHQEFREEPAGELEHWFSLYGEIRKVVRVADGGGDM